MSSLCSSHIVDCASSSLALAALPHSTSHRNAAAVNAFGVARMPNLMRAAPLQQSFCGTPVPLTRRQLRVLATNSVVAKVLDLEEEPEVVESDDEEDISPLTPSAYEVQQLLMQVCDETANIAEVQLKVGAFSLRVRRKIGKPAPPPKPVVQAPPVLGKAMVESIPADAVAPAPAPKTTKLSAALVKPVSNFYLMEAAADAGLLFITSPKVGLFRKGRVVKGKSSPPLCEEGQVVKKGQVVCYLQQLGTQQPVEADITGEVEKVLWQDGEPVGYGDPLIAIRPSFPGIKVKG